MTEGGARRIMDVAAMEDQAAARGARAAGTAPTAVIAPTHGWDSTVRVSSHHLALALAKRGWRVFFLSTPVSPWHALLRRSDLAVREKLAASRRGLVDDGSGVLSIVPTTLLPHTYRWPFKAPFSLRNWQRFASPNLKRLLARNGALEPELLVVDNVVMAWLLQALRPKKSVYRITDHYASFSTTTPSMRAAERQFAPEVDMVVYTADSLKAYAQSLAPKASLLLDHGIDADVFDQADLTLPEAYEKIPEPRAVFVGVIGEWFDVQAVNAMAERLPEVSFVMVGPDQGPGAGFADRRNLHVLGPKPRSAVPALLHHAAVGLIPFDRAGKPELVDGINPLKLYEYLISGLPVVTTAWPELERLEAPVIACGTPQDFPDAVLRALGGEGPDLAARTTFARQADWQARIGELLKALDLENA
ncbi:MAG: glycosyltransferase [Alphaproteobacteria bacterium]